MTRKTQAKTDPTLLSVRQVCKKFGISANHVYRHAEEWPHYKIGGALRFNKEELLEFLRVNPRG
ncbi:MAG: hypothetical protein OJF51_004862 [Nitrospira sp.]|nr:MAG: hypothetical protein OJF51_004862 [Nitrospira sp.]